MPDADPGLTGVRDAMVRRQLRARGVTSHVVLEAMRAVPREAFLPVHLREFAYEDAPLPVAEGQTISQPYIVAFMIEAQDLMGVSFQRKRVQRRELCRCICVLAP